MIVNLFFLEGTGSCGLTFCCVWFGCCWLLVGLGWVLFSCFCGCSVDGFFCGFFDVLCEILWVLLRIWTNFRRSFGFQLLIGW